MKKYIVEFIGTFFLMLVVALAVIKPGAETMAPLAIGSIIMVMVYAGGHISGGHYNTAITLGAWIRGRLTGRDAVPYWIAQFLGAAAAALAAIGIKGTSTVVPPVYNTVSFLIVEFLFSFALVYVVLQTATTRRIEGNSFFGLAIGFTVTAGAYATGTLSGAAFNPAVALGLIITGLSAPAYLLAYFIANFLGGAAAALVYNAVNREPAPRQQRPETATEERAHARV